MTAVDRIILGSDSCAFPSIAGTNRCSIVTSGGLTRTNSIGTGTNCLFDSRERCHETKM